MAAEPLKKLTVGAAVILVILVAGMAVGAMFYDDEGEEFFERVGRRMTQPMELRGRWLGMRVTAVNSRTAQKWGVPPSLDGVVVVEISETNGWRAQRAGVAPGDVIIAVDENKVRDLADLFEVSQRMDVSQAVLLDVLRWGQPMTLVLPSAIAGPMPIVPNVAQAPPMMAQPMAQPMPQPMAPPAQPVAWQQPGRGVGMGRGAQMICPADGTVWAQSAVHPHYRCPRCNGPLGGM